MSRHKLRLAGLILGIVAVFYFAVFLFGPPVLPPYKRQMLAVSMAVLAGLVTFFLSGMIGLEVRGSQPGFGDITIRASSGTAVFVLVLFLLLGPFAPVSSEDKALYRVRVIVLDAQQNPVEDADLRSSVGGEPKRVAGGWQFDIPSATKPATGQLELYARKADAFLSGRASLTLEDDYNPTVAIRLAADTTASVRGIVLDDLERTIEGAHVLVIGHAERGATTGVGGSFNLPAHAAVGQQVELYIEKSGYKPVRQWHPAGTGPATIVLTKE